MQHGNNCVYICMYENIVHQYVILGCDYKSLHFLSPFADLRVATCSCVGCTLQKGTKPMGHSKSRTHALSLFRENAFLNS